MAGTGLRIGTHYTDPGGVSDHVFILCAMLGFRFCLRLRDLPDRKLATLGPAAAVPGELLARTFPLTWEHIGFSGGFLVGTGRRTAGRRRPHKLGLARTAA